MAQTGPSARAAWGGACGLIAGAVALGCAEFLDGLFDAVPSMVGSVGEAVIDFAPDPVVEFGIETFGQSDKAALAVGILVLTALAAVGLGRAATRQFAIAIAGFSVFGVVGVLAGNREPGASLAATTVATAVAAGAGLATLAALLRLRPLPGTAALPPVAPVVPRDRRLFLAASAGVLVLAGAGTLAGRALRSAAAAAERAGVRLPRARRPVEPPPPAATLRVDGVSPLVTSNADFYKIDTRFFDVPAVDLDSWKLRVHGMVRNPFELSFEELLALPMVEEYVTLACVSNPVGGDLVGNAAWLGVPLRDLLERAEVDPGADQVVGRAVDDFTAGFPTTAVFDRRTALVAVGMNGEPLPRNHGFPARLVVAGLYGYVSATKWLSEIELTTFDAFDAYWIPRGWAQKAPIKTQSRIDTPRDGRRVRAGSVPVAGVAWAPTRGISRVEVQVDGGEWSAARLARPLNDNSWRQWVFDWDAAPGEHILRVRATDGRDDTQTREFTSPEPDGATGWHTIRVDVSDG